MGQSQSTTGSQRTPDPYRHLSDDELMALLYNRIDHDSWTLKLVDPDARQATASADTGLVQSPDPGTGSIVENQDDGAPLVDDSDNFADQDDCAPAVHESDSGENQDDCAPFVDDSDNVENQGDCEPLVDDSDNVSHVDAVDCSIVDRDTNPEPPTTPMVSSAIHSSDAIEPRVDASKDAEMLYDVGFRTITSANGTVQLRTRIFGESTGVTEWDQLRTLESFEHKSKSYTRGDIIWLKTEHADTKISELVAARIHEIKQYDDGQIILTVIWFYTRARAKGAKTDMNTWPKGVRHMLSNWMNVISPLAFCGHPTYESLGAPDDLVLDAWSTPFQVRSRTHESVYWTIHATPLPPSTQNTQASEDTTPTLAHSNITERSFVHKRPISAAEICAATGKIKKKPRFASEELSAPPNGSRQRHTDSIRRPSTASSAADGCSTTGYNGLTSTDGIPKMPDWYRALKWGQQRDKDHGNEDIKLQVLKAFITYMPKTSENSRPVRITHLAEAIHDAMFLRVTAQLLRNNGLLHHNGLPAVFAGSTATQYPSHVRSDARELYTKWSAQNFSVDLMHGIKFDASSATSIEPSYPGRRSAAVIGHNGLINGQWWPQQICLVRDGAHGSMQGGIASRAGHGVFSVVLATGISESKDYYPNEDNGDIILYCGTDGKNGSITENTQRMLDNFALGQPVRVIRSSTNTRSRYSPSQGFRYDGLYKITTYEILDRTIQRHRFKLVREPGQDEIRWQGVGKRPTSREVREWTSLHSSRKFIVAGK